MRKNIGVLIIALGIISGLLFFYAGIKLFASGKELKDLRSIGGTSVAEVYYQEMGNHGIAYSLISFALGFGIVSISLGFGGRFLFESETASDVVKATSLSQNLINPANVNKENKEQNHQ